MNQSRYLDEDIVIDDSGNRIREIREPIAFKNKENDESFVVKGSQSLRAIAYAAYGDASLWWIIADYNGIDNPWKDQEDGVELLIPSIAKVRGEIV